MSRPTTPRAKRAARIRSRAITVMRRVHLYLGIFLLPWVLLYGVSALLFNHPDWGTSREIRDLPGAALAAAPLGELAPERLAEALIASLAKGESGVELADVSGASLVGGLYYRGALEDAGGRTLESYTVRVDPAGRGARIYARPVVDDADGPVDPLEHVQPLDVAAAPLASIGDRLGALLVDRSETPLALELRSAPDLVFDADLDGVRHRVTYDLRRGTLGAIALADRDPLPDGERTTRLLKRLHTEHGYTPWTGAEAVWAGFVDLMGGAMVLWGLSGLVMWWQLKRTRRAGAWALAASALSALGLVAALWPALMR